MDWGWRIISSSLRLKEVVVQFVTKLRQKSAEILQSTMTTLRKKFEGYSVRNATVDSLVGIGLVSTALGYYAPLPIIWIGIIILTRLP